MLQVALAQVRMHARRFVAVGLAVMLGVAFLSATLMVNATTTASLAQSIGASYARADLVVTGADGQYIPAAVADDLADVPGVASAHALQRAFTQLDTGDRSSTAVLTSTAPERLETAALVGGSYPSGAEEIAIDENSAERLGVAPGDTVALDAGMTGADPATALGAALTVTAITVTSPEPMLSGAVQVLASPALVAEVSDGFTDVPNIQLALTQGADAGTVLTDVATVLEGSAGAVDFVVMSVAEQTVSDVAQLSGGTDALTGVLLAFALVAVLVAGLVISNTFSVLVAQRTRELALLRCIGAERRQVRISVLVEALIVGIVAAVLGVLLAMGVMGALVAFARQTDFGSFAVLAVPTSAVIIGVAVGVLMTLLAALVPARAATRVAPLAALRPADPIAAGTRSGRVRLIAGIAALVLGGGVLAVGAVTVSVLQGLAGGAVSFLGVVLLAPFFVPASVAAAGRLARPLGVPGDLASVNAIRNPGRTTASSAALMVGVTLVTMMMVGAQTARASFDRELAENFAVDLEVAGLGSASAAPGTPPPAVDQSTLLGIDGVRSVVELTPVVLTSADEGAQVVHAADPDEIRDVLRSEDAVLRDGMVLAPQTWTEAEITLEGADGPVTLPVTATDATFFQPLITTATAEELGGTPAAMIGTYVGNPDDPASEETALTLADALGTTYWLQLETGLDAEAVVEVQSRIVDATGVSEYQVSGAALERVAYNQIIDVMLLIVTALLAVAVLIALIGVANTLSLSVLERRRENSLLRALGLTRGQLRGMLAIEAVLIAGVAAVLGSGLGILYGWLGAQSALGGITTVTPSVPVLQIVAVLAVAVAAGLLASVLPARRAARLSPVAGLASD